MLDFCLRVRICSKHSTANVRVPKLYIQLEYLLSSKLRDISAEPILFLQSGGQSGRSSYLNAEVSYPACFIMKMYSAKTSGGSSLVQIGYPSTTILFFRASCGASGIDRKSTRL